MLDETEDLIKLVCTVGWPARNQAGTFQRTIGRVADRGAQYQMPAFPVSLLRDVSAFERFCEPHLAELNTQVGEPWELWFDVECDNVVLRRSLPPIITPLPRGPYLADQLMDAHTEMRQHADMIWTLHLQPYQVASVQIFKQTGLSPEAFDDIYSWFWGTKDGIGPEAIEMDNRLRTSSIRIAENMVEKSDDETAAQYAKIAFDLSPTEDSADEIRAEFVTLVEYWDRIAITKENAVKRLATAAREGIAEWNTMLSEDYYHEGLIAPITAEVDNLLTSGELDARRQRLRSLSATNPYRRGMELMELISANLGLVTALLTGILTEWPLEELRRRVPATTIQQIQRDSPWAPDTRLEKLAELSSTVIPLVPFTGEVMPYLQAFHAHLDADLPGIMSYALEQLPDA